MERSQTVQIRAWRNTQLSVFWRDLSGQTNYKIMIGLAQIDTTKTASICGRRKKVHFVSNGGQHGVIVEDLASGTFASPNCGGPAGIFAALTMQSAFLTAVEWTEESIARARFEVICAGKCSQMVGDILVPTTCPCSIPRPV
ncbi:hypothetical protein [Duganella vulcania]|uniref:Uncharacterized protein n=1 Tax=Duganella vulcania TaxID=2692166 RepID=A0A845GEM7_9BURK|nr:hypothetical protein [Duganella vulcania]MYM92754.1 hypothetical protein [Duganella vulcania]